MRLLDLEDLGAIEVVSEDLETTSSTVFIRKLQGADAYTRCISSGVQSLSVAILG